MRGAARVLDIAEMEGAVQVTLFTTVEIEGSDKPAATVESIVRYVA